ncbi:hypothetical protein [Sphingobium fuliginis]|jgi:hypothetical protein|uniref:hypothetical protein n=1 Tax=Sphingobium fuliginis (strain ATCC 27551) TaxID=336203 RepID=UPI0037C9A0FF
MTLETILQNRLGELLMVVARQEAHIAALEKDRADLVARLAEKEQEASGVGSFHAPEV